MSDRLVLSIIALINSSFWGIITNSYTVFLVTFVFSIFILALVKGGNK